MEKEEHVAMSIPVLFIELFDPFPGKLHQRLVLGQRFLAGVGKISQQAEVQVIVTICQEPDFERLDQILNVLSAS